MQNQFQKYYNKNQAEFCRLATEGQTPKTLFIGCSDSRVIPEMLTSSKPGDLFVVRNIGNLVPEYEDQNGYHGVTAAIEYAVEILNVQKIIVCGHSHCGAIAALYNPPTQASQNIKKWLTLAENAKITTDNVDQQILRLTEANSIQIQVERLKKFPCLKDKDITIEGWHFYIESGEVINLS